jgi:nucleotide-binding universal stress UspA family protein
MCKKLLVACDGSEGSQIAVVHAAILAKKLDAQLSALWVRGHLPHYPESIGEVAEEEDAALEFFENIKVQLGSISAAQGVIIQPNLRSGHPAQEIVRFAQENRVDLIVLGNRVIRGYGGNSWGTRLTGLTSTLRAAFSSFARKRKPRAVAKCSLALMDRVLPRERCKADLRWPSKSDLKWKCFG